MIKRITFAVVMLCAGNSLAYGASSINCGRAYDFADLSEFVYSCSKPACTETPPFPWVLIDESRAQYTYQVAVSGTANSTPPVANPKHIPNCSTAFQGAACSRQKTITDPIGFHAIALKDTVTDEIAIIYEGTSATSIKDWIANITHVQAMPRQYNSAIQFADKVIFDQCKLDKSCLNKIYTAGHSLGGGLAHYVALDRGLKSYIYNPTGLWGPTASALNTTNAAKSDVTMFVGEGINKLGIKQTDIVSRLGHQFNANIVEVPVNLPGIQASSNIIPGSLALDLLSDYLSLHLIGNLKKSISDLCNKTKIRKAHNNTPLQSTCSKADIDNGVFAAITPCGMNKQYQYQPYAYSKQLTGNITLSSIGITVGVPVPGYSNTNGIESMSFGNPLAPIESSVGIKTERFDFFDGFEPLINTAHMNRPYRPCPYPKEGPKVSSGRYSNATWGYTTDYVAYQERCHSIVMTFNDLVSREAFAEDLRNVIRNWVARYGQYVNVPQGYDPYCDARNNTALTGCVQH